MPTAAVFVKFIFFMVWFPPERLYHGFPMTKKRKTFAVEDIKEQANRFFLNSTNDFSSQRKTLQYFVGDILMQTGNYKGFGYLSKSDVKEGSTFGVDRTTNPVTFPDESRIFFYWYEKAI